MTTKETLVQLRRIAFVGTLTLDALAALFPRTYKTIGHNFVFGIDGSDHILFGQMVGDIVLISIVGLFTVFVLTTFIRKA